MYITNRAQNYYIFMIYAIVLCIFLYFCCFFLRNVPKSFETLTPQKIILTFFFKKICTYKKNIVLLYAKIEKTGKTTI